PGAHRRLRRSGSRHREPARHREVRANPPYRHRYHARRRSQARVIAAYPMSAPIVGSTAQVVLDGFSYWLLPNSYQHFNPRLRKATPRADGNEAYVDFGLGKKVWKF